MRRKEPSTDAFELLVPELAQFDAESINSQPGSTKTFASARNWYQRSILLSGKNYRKIDPVTSALPRNGWRAGSFFSCIFIGVVLCFNIAFTVYAIIANPPSENGVGTLKHGSCRVVLSTSTWIHVAINACSTLIVAASNYNMQCLTAPTRTEVDRIHMEQKHMEIGVHSVRNLSKKPMWKVFLWFALLFSTLPLHLLWNSAIFTVSTINEYAGLVVTSDFLETYDIGLDCSEEALLKYRWTNSDAGTKNYTTCWLISEAEAGRLKTISPSECISRYTEKLATNDYNLIAVTNNTRSLPSKSFPANLSLPVLAYFDSTTYSFDLAAWCDATCPSTWCQPWLASEDEDPCELGNPDWFKTIETDSTLWCNTTDWDSSHTTFGCYQWATNGSIWNASEITGPADWTCTTDDIYQGNCSASTALKKSSEWTILPENYQIDHCLVSEANANCKLQYSSTILYAVITCNAIKFLAVLIHFLLADDPILVTIGDAVASFLKEPDVTTKHNCLRTTNDQRRDYYVPAKKWLGQDDWKPRIWRNNPKRVQRWAQAVPWSHIMVSCTMWFPCPLLAGTFFDAGRSATAGESIIESGFGNMNMRTLVAISKYKGGSDLSIVTTSLVVNAPQVLFSSLYFMYNTVYTCMTSAYEWSLFSNHRKGVRVTFPTGSQRSSYWLQLPWKFSLPLLIASALLHWLISQSIFLVNLQIWTPMNRALTGPDQYYPMASESGIITAFGYSPLAILLAIVVGTLMLICLLVVCCFPLNPGATLVGGNSYAISAACHAPAEDVDVATKPLLWGAVSHQDGLRPGHCCFTSLEVEEPRVGDMYA